MISEAFIKRVLMFIGVIFSGLITLIFISTPESLTVPVPDSFPTITTKSSLNREFEDAKDFFESSISDQIRGATLASVVAWSPNSKYIVTNVRISSSEKTTTKPYIFDMPNKKYIEIPNTNWIDSVSWSGSKIAYATDAGYGFFDIENSETNVFGVGEEKGNGNPIISPDGTYIAYPQDGIMVYSLRAKESIRITTNPNDVPALWKSDNKTLVIFSKTRTNTPEKILAELHIGTKAAKSITTLPQSPINATWISSDESALLTLGIDDSYFDYTYNFSSNKLTLLAETTEGLAFTSVKDRGVGTLKGNRISIYDKNGEKIQESKREEKSRIANFAMTSPYSAFLIREKGKLYDSAIFNINNSTEETLEDLHVPYVIVSPNGRSAVTISEDSDSANFIIIPPTT